jgi:hypothetical protein
VVIFFVVFPAIALAEEHHSLTPLLLDLQGWEAKKPEGISMYMGAVKIINATRDYTNGNKDITAMVMIGNNYMTNEQIQDLKAESMDAKMSISQIDGFKVHTSHTKSKNSGAVIVFLSEREIEGALFTVSYEGLSEKEALGIAKKFNWKKMKAAVDELF